MITYEYVADKDYSYDDMHWWTLFSDIDLRESKECHTPHSIFEKRR